jgi:hypothetical protein
MKKQTTTSGMAGEISTYVMRGNRTAQDLQKHFRLTAQAARAIIAKAKPHLGRSTGDKDNAAYMKAVGAILKGGNVFEAVSPQSVAAGALGAMSASRDAAVQHVNEGDAGTMQQQRASATLKMSRMGRQIAGGMSHSKAVSVLSEAGWSPAKIEDQLKRAGHHTADVERWMGAALNEAKAESKSKGTVRVTVKKKDDEWIAAYYLDGKYQEGPTYYAGGGDRSDKQDAMGSAKDMRKRAKAAGYTVQEDALDEGDVSEALNAKDKAVIVAFTEKKPMEGRKLSTDGTRLDFNGMGGRGVAEWSNSKIYMGDTGSSQDDMVHRAIRKEASRNWIGESTDEESPSVLGDKLKALFDAERSLYGPDGKGKDAAKSVRTALEAKVKRLGRELMKAGGGYAQLVSPAMHHARKGTDWKTFARKMVTSNMESVDEAAEFIAIYNSKRIEFKAESLYAAKLHAIKELKVPKSKTGLLALMNKKEYDREGFRHEDVDEATITAAAALAQMKSGDRVVLSTPQGQTVSGKAVMRGPHGWAVNLGGRHGTPGVATEANLVKWKGKAVVNESGPTPPRGPKSVVEGVMGLQDQAHARELGIDESVLGRANGLPTSLRKYSHALPKGLGQPQKYDTRDGVKEGYYLTLTDNKRGLSNRPGSSSGSLTAVFTVENLLSQFKKAEGEHGQHGHTTLTFKKGEGKAPKIVEARLSGGAGGSKKKAAKKKESDHGEHHSMFEGLDEDEKANARKMKAKGYRFIIVFPGNKPEPLYAKTLSMATELIKDHGAPKGVKGQPIDKFINEANDDKTDDLPAKAEAGLKAKAKEMGATTVTGKGPSVNATFKDQKKAQAFLKHAKTVGKAAMRRSGDTEFTVHIDEDVDEGAPKPVTMSMADQVAMNTGPKGGGITPAIHAWASKKYGKGNGVSITSLSAAQQRGSMSIDAPKGKHITISVRGQYVIVKAEGKKAAFFELNESEDCPEIVEIGDGRFYIEGIGMCETREEAEGHLLLDEEDLDETRKSKGHVAFLGDFEYVIVDGGSDGMVLGRAPTTNAFDTSGNRHARFEAPSWQAEQAMKLAFSGFQQKVDPKAMQRLKKLLKEDVSEAQVIEAEGKAKKNDPEIIAALRKIVRDHQHAKVKDSTGKSMNVDATSANAIVAVFDALSTGNRKKYITVPLPRMASMAFKMLRPAESTDEGPAPLTVTVKDIFDNGDHNHPRYTVNIETNNRDSYTFGMFEPGSEPDAPVGDAVVSNFTNFIKGAARRGEAQTKISMKQLPDSLRGQLETLISDPSRWQPDLEYDEDLDEFTSASIPAIGTMHPWVSPYGSEMSLIGSPDELGDDEDDTAEDRLDESVKPTLEGFHFVLTGSLVQWDRNEMVKAAKRRNGYYNANAMGLYLAAVSRAEKDPKMRGVKKTSSDPEDLKKLIAVLSDHFDPNFPPVKKTIKQIQAFIDTGKLPKYPTPPKQRKIADDIEDSIEDCPEIAEAFDWIEEYEELIEARQERGHTGMLNGKRVVNAPVARGSKTAASMLLNTADTKLIGFLEKGIGKLRVAIRKAQAADQGLQLHAVAGVSSKQLLQPVIKALEGYKADLEKVIKQANASESVDESVDEGTTLHDALVSFFVANRGRAYTASNIAKLQSVAIGEAMKTLSTMVREGTIQFKRGEGYSLRGGKGIRIPGALPSTRPARITNQVTYNYEDVEATFEHDEELDEGGKVLTAADFSKGDAGGKGPVNTDPLDGPAPAVQTDGTLDTDEAEETTTSGGVGGYARGNIGGEPENKGREGGIRDDSKKKKGPRSIFSNGPIGRVLEQMREAKPDATDEELLELLDLDERTFKVIEVFSRNDQNKGPWVVADPYGKEWEHASKEEALQAAQDIADVEKWDVAFIGQGVASEDADESVADNKRPVKLGPLEKEVMRVVRAFGTQKFTAAECQAASNALNKLSTAEIGGAIDQLIRKGMLAGANDYFSILGEDEMDEASREAIYGARDKKEKAAKRKAKSKAAEKKMWADHDKAATAKRNEDTDEDDTDEETPWVETYDTCEASEWDRIVRNLKQLKIGGLYEMTISGGVDYILYVTEIQKNGAPKGVQYDIARNKATLQSFQGYNGTFKHIRASDLSEWGNAKRKIEAKAGRALPMAESEEEPETVEESVVREPLQFPESALEKYVLAAQAAGINEDDPCFVFENGTFTVEVPAEIAPRLRELVGV